MPYSHSALTASSQQKGKKLKPSRFKPELRRSREALRHLHHPPASFAVEGKKQADRFALLSQVQGRQLWSALAGTGKGLRSSKEDMTQPQGRVFAVGGQAFRRHSEIGSQFQGREQASSYSKHITSYLPDTFLDTFLMWNQTTLHGDAGA